MPNKEEIKVLELNETEAFYLFDFVSKNWFDFIDTIVDKNNMNELEKEIYNILLNLSNKIYALKGGNNAK